VDRPGDDPLKLTSETELAVWARFAAAALPVTMPRNALSEKEQAAKQAGEYADALMREYIERIAELK